MATAGVVYQIGRVSNKIVGLVLKFSIIVTGMIIILQVMSTFSDALMRYFFSQPIPGIVGVNTLSMPVLTFISLAAVQQLRGHISVNLVTIHLSARTQLVLETAIFVIAIGFMALLGLRSWGGAIHALNVGEYYYGAARVPMWWARMAVPVGSWLLCLQYMRDIAGNVVQLRKGQILHAQGDVICQ